MRVQPKLTLHLVALITCASLANEVLATCPGAAQGPPCQEYWRTEAVFIGLATRVVRTPNNTGLEVGPYYRTTVHFYIEEAFKGVDGTGIVFDLDQCGYLFKEGERYLVYAHRNPNNNKLEVRAGNSRTRPLSEAAEDLQYIRGLSGESGSRVFGKINLHTFNLKNSFIDESLENIKITVEGNNQHQEVFTDSDGRYEFKVLPAGTYKLSAQIPAYLSFDEQTVTLTGRGCVQLDTFALRKTQISGRVLNVNGQPAPGVSVTLVSADFSPEQIFSEGKSKAPSALSFTNEDGQYRFSHLGPGRYLVIINRTEFERAHGNERWRTLPRLFYPGVNDLRGATVIVLRRDQEPEEYNFHLPVPD